MIIKNLCLLSLNEKEDLTQLNYIQNKILNILKNYIEVTRKKVNRFYPSTTENLIILFIVTKMS